jgi:hypothetical protein
MKNRPPCKAPFPIWAVTIVVLWASIGTAPTVGAQSPRASLRAAMDNELVTVFAGQRQVLEYRLAQSPFKPYVSKLFSPAGVQILRDSPSDHKHHHALMFALAVGNVNFWEEKEGAGIERPRSGRLRQAGSRSGTPAAGLSQLIDWVDPGSNRTMAVERRTVEVLDTADIPATLVTWQTRLENAGKTESIQLAGSHYFGLGMRFIEAMDRNGRFFNPDGLEGEVVRGTERLTPTRWCAYSASADGGQVTAVVFDHPANPRHPARIFTMSAPFAYLAATLNLWKEPLRLAPGTAMDLVYGIAVWDGTPGAEQIESLYRRWAK